MILAAYRANFWYAFLAATTLVLGAAYTLWLVKRVIFGPVANDQVAEDEAISTAVNSWCWRVLAAGGAAARPLACAARAHHGSVRTATCSSSSA